MKEKKHLHMYGVGTMYVWICVMVTIAGVVLAKLDLLISGDIEQWILPCMIIGLNGIVICYFVKYKMEENTNILLTREKCNDKIAVVSCF